MDVSIQEVYDILRVFAFELDGAMYGVDLLKKIKKGSFAPCPNQEDIILKTGVSLMLTIYSRVDMAGLKVPHKNVGVRAGALTAHCAAFGLDVIGVVETEVVEMKDHGEKLQQNPCWYRSVRTSF